MQVWEHRVELMAYTALAGGLAAGGDAGWECCSAQWVQTSGMYEWQWVVIWKRPKVAAGG